MKMGCGQCGRKVALCENCHRCDDHCACSYTHAEFDADELGLDPETDNTPETETRHA